MSWNPDCLHRVELPFGNATVLYPEASPTRCTAALHLKADPIGLVRGRKGAEARFVLEKYVNDREYTTPANLQRLRIRGPSRKRSLAMREFVRGIEALDRFVRREPLRRTPECVFGVLVLESEPVDPRL